MTTHNAAMPLSFMSTGQTAVLSEICAGQAVRQRLTALGLIAGMTVRVIQNDSAGPLILAVAHVSRLAIGRGMAQQIMVTPLAGGS
jgi:Fe2+ transport system protein FeoA